MEHFTEKEANVLLLQGWGLIFLILGIAYFIGWLLGNN